MGLSTKDPNFIAVATFADKFLGRATHLDSNGDGSCLYALVMNGYELQQ